MATKVAIEVDVKVDGADKNLGKVKNELKGVEQQAKKSTDQIKSGFDAAGKQATSLPGPVGRAAQAFQSMVGGIKSGIAALKTLRGALIATGLGALVVVIGSLISYFTETERGAQKLRIAMAAVGAAVGVVKDAMVGLGESFVQFFRGDFKGAVNTLKSSFTGLGDEIVKDTKAAIELERAMNQVKVQERELGVERAKTLQIIAEARLAAEDETRSAEERIAKLQEAAALEADLTAKELANEEEKLRIMQEQAALNESDEATLQAIADQEAKVAQVQLNSLNLNRRLKTELNSLEREIETERKQRADDEQKRLEDVNKKELELLEQLKESRIALIQDEEERKVAEAQLALENKLAQIEGDSAAEIELRKNLEAISDQEIQAIRQEFRDKELELLEAQAKKKKELEDKAVADVKKAEDEKKKLRQDGLTAAGSILGSLNQLIAASGNQSKEALALQKTLAVAQIAIDTAKAITGAIAQAQSVPYPANLVAIATGVVLLVLLRLFQHSTLLMYQAEVPQRQPLHRWQPLQLSNKQLLEQPNSEERNKPSSHQFKPMSWRQK
ncbi:MAG: hypothetical protein ACYTFV_16880 [Planctomycetota bacterium]|jgi:hypothetical protein